MLRALQLPQGTAKTVLSLKPGLLLNAHRKGRQRDLGHCPRVERACSPCLGCAESCYFPEINPVARDAWALYWKVRDENSRWVTGLVTHVQPGKFDSA